MNTTLIIMCVVISLVALAFSAFAIFMCHLMALGIGRFKQDVNAVVKKNNIIQEQKKNNQFTYDNTH